MGKLAALQLDDEFIIYFNRGALGAFMGKYNRQASIVYLIYML